MTIEIIAKCDGRGCHNSLEINYDTDKEIERIGWGVDYNEGLCYCPECCKIAKKEAKGEIT